MPANSVSKAVMEGDGMKLRPFMRRMVGVDAMVWRFFSPVE